MTKTIKDVLTLAETWPDWAQQELADLSLEIDREVKAGTYHATREELRKIDEGLAAARRGDIATGEEIESVFAKYRRG